MKAIILARVSTSEQIQDGQSVPAQLARAREYAIMKTLDVIQEFSFDESSLKDHRKKFELVLDAVRKSKEPIALIAETIDRVQRSFKESVQLLELIKEDKVVVHFIREGLVIHKNSNSSEFIRWDMGVMFARSYVLNISDNVKRTNELKIRNGEWLGKPRLGFMNTISENGKKTIVKDPLRAHLIAELFRLFASGNYSIQTIKNELDAKGLRTEHGTMPSRSTYGFILRDPFYCGTAVSKTHGAYVHCYERIISTELFDKCQTILDDKKKKVQVLKAKPYILRGLMHCIHCGCTMSPETQKGHVYYSCTNAKGTCKRVYIREEVLLEPILSVLEQFGSISKETQEMIVGELRKTTEAEVVYHKAQIERIQAEYAKVQQKITRLLDIRLEDETFSKELFESKLQELKTLQSRLTLELEEHSKADQQYLTTISTVLSLARRAKFIFESSEIGEKRGFINFLLQNLVVDEKKLYFTIASPFNVVLDLTTCPIGLPR